MKPAYRNLVFVLVLMVVGAGCTIRHDYVWSDYTVPADQISAQAKFTDGQKINVIEGKSSESKTLLGRIGVHEYYGTPQSLTHGIVDELTRELQKRRLDVNAAADKSLEVAVSRVYFEQGMWRGAATIEFTVKFGNGKSKPFTVRNSTPGTVPRAYDGAVALAVVQIINDPEVRDYVNG